MTKAINDYHRKAGDVPRLLVVILPARAADLPGHAFLVCQQMIVVEIFAGTSHFFVIFKVSTPERDVVVKNMSR